MSDRWEMNEAYKAGRQERWFVMLLEMEGMEIGAEVEAQMTTMLAHDD